MERFPVLNPVLGNPWRNLAPVRFEPSLNFSQNTCYDASSSTTRTKVTRTRTRSAHLRNTNFVRLCKIFPDVVQSKIRAALTICDNNINGAVNLLAWYHAFTKGRVQHGVVLPPTSEEFIHYHHDTKPGFQDSQMNGLKITNLDEDDEKEKKVFPALHFQIKDGKLIETGIENLPPCGSFPKMEKGVLPGFAMCSSSSSVTMTSINQISGSSTITARSSVYEFCNEDLEEESPPPPFVRNPRQVSRKVGIILKKTNSGSYAVTLL